LKSDKGFLEFFSAEGRARKIAVIVLVGLLLLMIGGLNFRQGRALTSEEERAAEMCELMGGVGDCRVMMTYHPDDDGRVYAVLILCEGADSPAVRERVTSLFCSLYGIGAHRVEIQPLKKEN
jgi:hypothetical protein